MHRCEQPPPSSSSRVPLGIITTTERPSLHVQCNHQQEKMHKTRISPEAEVPSATTSKVRYQMERALKQRVIYSLARFQGAFSPSCQHLCMIHPSTVKQTNLLPSHSSLLPPARERCPQMKSWGDFF